MFMCIEFRDVDIDETHARVLESGFGRGRKIAEARAYGNHQVGLARKDVSAGSSGHAEGFQILRVIPGKRALARHRLPDRDARPFHEARQRFARSAVNDAPARDDERLPRRANPFYGASEERAISERSGDMPGALL